MVHSILRHAGPGSWSVSGGWAAEEALGQLGWLVEVHLEVGSCGDPVASTIVGVTGDLPRVVRWCARLSLRSVVPGSAGPGRQRPGRRARSGDAVREA